MKTIIVIAVSTAFVLLSMYSLDYASEGYTFSQRKALVKAMDKALAESKTENRQAMLIRELYE